MISRDLSDWPGWSYSSLCICLVSAFAASIVFLLVSFQFTQTRFGSYPSSCLVVVNIHQQPCTLIRAFGIAFLPLTCIYKLLGEPVAIVQVVSAAAPQPISGEIFGTRGTTAPTAGELALSAGTAHSVHHPRRTDGVGERRFSAACGDKNERMNEKHPGYCLQVQLVGLFQINAHLCHFCFARLVQLNVLSRDSIHIHFKITERFSQVRQARHRQHVEQRDYGSLFLGFSQREQSAPQWQWFLSKGHCRFIQIESGSNFFFFTLSVMTEWSRSHYSLTPTAF